MKNNNINNNINNNGFTLVELLAVIVILAIIMIIAIPAVLETMTSARRKSFSEYAMKVSTGAEKQYLEDQLTSNPGTCVLYDIKKDLGFSSTGNYEGYVIVKMTNNDPKIYVTLKDNDYMIYGVDGNKLETVEIKNYVDGDYLSDINLLSVAKCEVYSVVKENSTTIEKYEKKTATLIENPESSTPIEKKLLTGEKKGSNDWVGVYENGKMIGCYNSTGNFDKDGNSLNDGSLETSYCVGQGYESTNSDECKAHQSISCCTASTEYTGNLSSQTYHYNFSITNNSKYKSSCGITWFSINGGDFIPRGLGLPGGGGLKETEVYED